MFKKIALFILLAAGQGIPLQGSEQMEMESNLIAKDYTVNVYTALELVNAIQAAAANTEECTKIIINGELIGNFEIPLTHHRIILAGGQYGGTLNANGYGTTLLVNFGARVILENLTIKGGNTNTGENQFSYGYGIVNEGSLKIFDCLITNNINSGGIWNWTELTIENSSVSNNSSSGLYNDFGSAEIRNCSFNNNNGFGIYNFLASIQIKNSSASNNYLSGMYNDYSALVEIKDCAFNQNGLSGIYNEYSSLVTIKGSTFENNNIFGLYSEGSVIKSEKCSFNYNSNYGVYLDENSVGFFFKCAMDGNGDSGVFMDFSTGEFNKCQIIGNSSFSHAGGFHNSNESISTLKDCNIQYNESNSDGGGLYNDFFLTLIDSIVDGNASYGNGGGIYNSSNFSYNVQYSKIIVRNTSITDNYSDDHGGGVYNIGFANLTFANVEGNIADYGGGLSNESNGSLTLVKSSVEYNLAQFNGGGIYSPSIYLNLIDTNVLNNTPNQIVP